LHQSVDSSRRVNRGVRLSWNEKVMDTLKSLDTPEFHRLDGCFDGMSGLLSEGQLDWYFEAKGFELNDVDFDVTSIIKAAYPRSNPEKARITECSD
jgi:hypothetical protein